MGRKLPAVEGFLGETLSITLNFKKAGFPSFDYTVFLFRSIFIIVNFHDRSPGRRVQTATVAMF